VQKIDHFQNKTFKLLLPPWSCMGPGGNKNRNLDNTTHRSDSSAAWEASANLVVAVFKRSSDLSKSSSSSWILLFNAATSASACVVQQKHELANVLGTQNFNRNHPVASVWAPCSPFSDT
jgi:hypothetical protein